MTRSTTAWLTVSIVLSLAVATGAAPTTQPSRETYREFAMKHQGDAAAGKAMFLETQKIACSNCHTTDGKGGKPVRIFSRLATSIAAMI